MKYNIRLYQGRQVLEFFWGVGWGWVWESYPFLFLPFTQTQNFICYPKIAGGGGRLTLPHKPPCLYAIVYIHFITVANITCSWTKVPETPYLHHYSMINFCEVGPPLSTRLGVIGCVEAGIHTTPMWGVLPVLISYHRYGIVEVTTFGHFAVVWGVPAYEGKPDNEIRSLVMRSNVTNYRRNKRQVILTTFGNSAVVWGATSL